MQTKPTVAAAVPVMQKPAPVTPVAHPAASTHDTGAARNGARFDALRDIKALHMDPDYQRLMGNSAEGDSLSAQTQYDLKMLHKVLGEKETTVPATAKAAPAVASRPNVVKPMAKVAAQPIPAKPVPAKPSPAQAVASPAKPMATLPLSREQPAARPAPPPVKLANTVSPSKPVAVESAKIPTPQKPVAPKAAPVPSGQHGAHFWTPEMPKLSREESVEERVAEESAAVKAPPVPEQSFVHAGGAPAPAGAASPGPAPAFHPAMGTKTLLDRGLPRQGFEGSSVAHEDGKTYTKDWGMEYGMALHKEESAPQEPIKGGGAATLPGKVLIGLFAAAAWCVGA